MNAPDCIITVGKFEGIHLGHRALIEEVVRRAKAAGVASQVVAYDPHPFKILRDANYKPIFSRHERDELIFSLGVDYIITLDFDAKIAAMSPAEFCFQLFGANNVREIIVGENYRFGKNREGSIENLREHAHVHIFKNVADISTSKIRELLAKNELKKAELLLGFPFFIAGEVTKGRQLGRVLGFPTLNIYPPHDKFLPKNGVYKTRTTIDGVTMTGLTNIGERPTVDDSKKISAETFLPNLKSRDEMYGKKIKVEFLRFIREERRFNSTDELQSQIITDLGELK